MSAKPMTRTEWSQCLANTFSACVEAEYQDQIKAAVLAEREACAKICDALANDQSEWAEHRATAIDLADAIRARTSHD